MICRTVFQGAALNSSDRQIATLPYKLIVWSLSFLCVCKGCLNLVGIRLRKKRISENLNLHDYMITVLTIHVVRSY